jgi:hypothetical protein
LSQIYRVVINGGVRWNSAYAMIHRAIKLKDALMLYQEYHRSDGSLKDDLLQYDDWQELLQLHELLEPIHGCSLNVQSTADDGQHGALHEVLTTMDYLLSHLEEAKKRLDDPKIVTHFKASVNLGWKKLDYYYNLSDDTPAYRLAIFLHPHYRFKCFEQKWAKKPRWLDEAREVIHTAYNQAKEKHCDDLRRASPTVRRELSRLAAYNNLDDEDGHDAGDDLQQYWHEKHTKHDVESLQW